MSSRLAPLIPASRAATPLVNQKSILHGGDYNPEQWLSETPTILDEDAVLMRQTGINSATVGVFSWSALEESEGHFTFDWLDRVLDMQALQGNRVILATPTGALPLWLGRKYPDARRVGRDGIRAHIGARHRHCWTSPALRERVTIINTHLAERYAKHPALSMWHVSNELAGECYCERCRAAWAAWLERRYGSLAKMNDAFWAGFWSHHASSFDQVEPIDGAMDGVGLDWFRFNTEQLINWYQFEADLLRPITPHVPITTNFMTTTHGVNYQAIARVVDVIADDQYPTYDPDLPGFAKAGAYWSMKNDLYRCMKPGRTFMLMESCPGRPQQRLPHRCKRPGVHRLEMLQAVAHGADGTCYFQFRAGRGGLEKLHGAVVEHWGTHRHAQTRRFAELRALSDTYARLGEDLLGASVRPQVVLVYDWESRWAQALTSGTGIRWPDPPNPRHHYDEIATEQYEAFWNCGIPVDVIGNDRDFSPYKLLVLPMHWIMTRELSAKLRRFVHGGGTLVATWDTAMADQNNRMLNGGWSGEGLGEIMGLWVEEMDRHTPGTPRAIAGLPGRGGDLAALMHLEGATAIATFAEDFYTGWPAVTVHSFGKGKAYYIGTRLDGEARSALYGRIIAEAGCASVLGGEPLPPGVTVQIRGAGDEAFVFLLNFSNAAQVVPLKGMRLIDLENGRAVSGEVDLEPLGAHVYRVAGGV